MDAQFEPREVVKVMPSSPRRWDCDDCGNTIAAGDPMAIVRIAGQGLVPICETCQQSEASVQAAQSPVASGMTCPHCGTATDDEGRRFADRPNPGNSLGNHKKWCRSNPRNAGGAPKRSGGTIPAPVAATPAPPAAPAAPAAPPAQVTPAPAPTPAPTPTDGELPEHYSAQLERQRTEIVSEFAALSSSLGKTRMSKRGIEVLELLRQAHAARQPVFLRGASGVGKSVGVRIIASEANKPVVSLNLTKATRMEALIGQPVFRGSDQPIGWNDGMLGAAARNGYICNLEEVTRSPETIARLFSITDQLGRSLPLTENPYESSIDVHPDFWLVASGNPTGSGYHTGDLDTAFLSRFFVIDINEPLADEAQLLADNGMNPTNARMLMELVTSLRECEYPINTRDIVQVARLTAAGMSFQDAVRGAIAHKMKLEVARDAVMSLADMHGWV